MALICSLVRIATVTKLQTASLLHEEELQIGVLVSSVHAKTPQLEKIRGKNAAVPPRDNKFPSAVSFLVMLIAHEIKKNKRMIGDLMVSKNCSICCLGEESLSSRKLRACRIIPRASREKHCLGLRTRVLARYGLGSRVVYGKDSSCVLCARSVHCARRSRGWGYGWYIQ